MSMMRELYTQILMHARAHGAGPGDAAARCAGHHRGGGSDKPLALRLPEPLFRTNFRALRYSEVRRIHLLSTLVNFTKRPF